MEKIFKVILISCLLCTFARSQAQSTRETDSLALVKLYQATGGGNWKHNLNWLTGPINTWYGVTLQLQTNRVLKLHLFDNNLTGELPEELATLDSAKSIILSNNNLYGNIPLLNKIPFYNTYSSGKYYGTEYQLWYQDHPLAGNYYEFSDVEKDTSIYNKSKIIEFLPASAYENLLKSKPFGKTTNLRLNQGASYTLSFDYKKTKDTLNFEWFLLKGVNSVLMGTSQRPEFTINSFDSLIHAGTWYCMIQRKNQIVGPYQQAVFQNSQPVYLAGIINKKPKVNLVKPSDLIIINFEDSQTYVRSLEEDFDRIELSAEDDFNPTGLSYKVDYVPQHLQFVIKDSEFNETLYLPQNFSGKEKFYICLKRKNKSWIGKDSLIIKATDESGAESKGKFYFESLEERELQAIQDLNPADISYKITPSGTWFYFKNSKGIENIQYTVSQDVLNDTGCEVAGSYIFTRMVDMADSIFIPEIKNVPLKDISYSISILPVNRIGTGQGADLGFNIFNLTKSKIPLSNFEFQLLENPDQLSIIPKSAFLNCDNIYRLYLSVNGIIDSTRELLLNNHYYIPIKKGISYDLIFKDIMNRYTSDPYHLFLSRTEKETPKVTGSLKWNVSCKKQIKKATWVKNFYPPLTYQFSPSAHFDIKDEGEFIEITPKDNQWEGTAAILFKITDAGGFVIDTFALATRVKTNVPVKFKTDTLGLNIKNEWTDINLLSELEDVETPDSLMKVKILKQGNIRLKDSHYKTKIMLGKALSGVDTLTIEATDEGCANAKLTYIIKFDSTGITNQAPVFISKMKEWWFFDSINKLNPSRGYYYVDELLASPLIFDLRHFVADDQPFEDLTFTIKEIDKFGNDRISDITFDQGLDIQIKNGILTIKPKENTFYGYGKVQNERMLTTSFWIKILAEDPFGEKLNTVAAYIHISERPINFKSGVKNVIYICPGDTQTVNVRDFVESNIINGRSVPPFSIFDPGDLLPTKEYKVKGESIEFIEKRNIFLPEQEQLLMFLKFSLPFYNTFNDPQESWLKFDNFYIISQPTCNTNPIIQKIPVQKLVNGQSANLNLWSKVQDEQQAKDLFWTFGAGSKLNYSYDYDSGELEVTAKHFDWKGVDSLFVEVEDMAGLKASTTIYYTNQSSPVIYPAINNITIKRGEVVPLINLSNRAIDDETTSDKIEWKVLTDSEIEGSISSTKALVLNVKDNIWIGVTTITLIAMDETGLTDTSRFTLEVKDIGLDVEEFESSCISKIYPNPVSDILTISSCKKSKGGVIRLIDVLGNVVVEKEITMAGDQSLDVSGVVSGVYFIMLFSELEGIKEVGKVAVY